MLERGGDDVVWEWRGKLQEELLVPRRRRGAVGLWRHEVHPKYDRSTQTFDEGAKAVRVTTKKPSLQHDQSAQRREYDSSSSVNVNHSNNSVGIGHTRQAISGTQTIQMHMCMEHNVKRYLFMSSSNQIDPSVILMTGGSF